MGLARSYLFEGLNAVEIEPLAAGEVQDAARASGYVLTGVTVEAHGLCAECASVT